MNKFQKLVLRLLAAILWRLVYKNELKAGLYKDMIAKHSLLINETMNEIDRR